MWKAKTVCALRSEPMHTTTAVNDASNGDDRESSSIYARLMRLVSSKDRGPSESSSNMRVLLPAPLLPSSVLVAVHAASAHRGH